jgi:TRAP-type mannitol/chloroaromatic compound transport system substrate-binding protein
VGPYDDEKLGFNKVAQYYYYPGWWEGGPLTTMLINEKQWNGLPKSYQAALQAACAEACVWMPAKYDAQNPAALRRLVGGGTKLRPFPRPVMEACEKAAYELYDELQAKASTGSGFIRAGKFRDEQFPWFRVAESTYDNYTFYRRLGCSPTTPSARGCLAEITAREL